MIRTEELQKAVPTATGPLAILKGISLHIKARESVAISGASGSGKSTLLGLLAGLDLPSSGKVWLGEREITALDEDRRAQVRAELVGFVFQSFQLLPSLTALENVMLPLELRGRRDARNAATEYLQRVGLGARQTHYPRQLSGGEQQRVAIARAFANTPRILFADEPTGNLDSATGAHIIDLLFALNREADTTLVLVTHEQRLAERCARRIEMAAGEIVGDHVSGDDVSTDGATDVDAAIDGARAVSGR
jgi:putative ABC transport system ATP-binding protein